MDVWINAREKAQFLKHLPKQQTSNRINFSRMAREFIEETLYDKAVESYNKEKQNRIT